MFIEYSAPEIEQLSLAELLLLLNTYSYLAITCAPQATVINIRWSTNSSLIVNDHQLAMYINDFCDRWAMKNVPFSKAEKEQIVCDVDSWTCFL